eukprot:1149352-Pelagomonas_calceolata.AAC.2
MRTAPEHGEQELMRNGHTRHGTPACTHVATRVALLAYQLNVSTDGIPVESTGVLPTEAIIRQAVENLMLRINVLQDELNHPPGHQIGHYQAIWHGGPADLGACGSAQSSSSVDQAIRLIWGRRWLRCECYCWVKQLSRADDQAGMQALLI